MLDGREVRDGEKIRVMPLPASAISRLSDHAGAYVICVTCLKCRHEREMVPRSLAHRVGWDASLEAAARRFRCSRCQGRQVRVEVSFPSRPRGWRANPS